MGYDLAGTPKGQEEGSPQSIYSPLPYEERLSAWIFIELQAERSPLLSRICRETYGQEGHVVLEEQGQQVLLSESEDLSAQIRASRLDGTAARRVRAFVAKASRTSPDFTLQGASVEAALSCLNRIRR